MNWARVEEIFELTVKLEGDWTAFLGGSSDTDTFLASFIDLPWIY